MEIYYNGKFLSFLKGILMMPLNKRAMYYQLAISNHQTRLPINSNIGLHSTEVSAKGVPWKYPGNPDWCSDNCLFSTNSQLNPIAKDSIHTDLWTWKMRDIVYMESSPLHSSVFERRYSSDYQEWNINQPRQKNFRTTICADSRICLGNSDRDLQV